MNYPRTKLEWLVLLDSVERDGEKGLARFVEQFTAFKEAMAKHETTREDLNAYFAIHAELNPKGRAEQRELAKPYVKTALAALAELLNSDDEKVRNSVREDLKSLGVEIDQLPELLKLDNDAVLALLQGQRGAKS